MPESFPTRVPNTRVACHASDTNKTPKSNTNARAGTGLDWTLERTLRAAVRNSALNSSSAAAAARSRRSRSFAICSRRFARPLSSSEGRPRSRVPTGRSAGEYRVRRHRGPQKVHGAVGFPPVGRRVSRVRRRAGRRVGSSVGSGSSFTKTCRTAVFQFDAIAFGANVATSTSRSIVLLT